MFERYTEQARRLVFFARYEASQLGNPAIDTEHLLLGLLREATAVTAIFKRAGLSAAAVRQEIESRALRVDRVSTSVDIPLTEHAMRTLRFASEEAGRLGSEHIGTEHILLGLLSQTETTTGEILRSHGLRLDEVREDVRLSGRRPAPEAPPSSPFDKLREFLKQLEERRARYHVSLFRGDALRVEVALAEERWAVTFFADGRVTADEFWLSSGSRDEASLARLLEKLGPTQGEG